MFLLYCIIISKNHLPNYRFFPRFSSKKRHDQEPASNSGRRYIALKSGVLNKNWVNVADILKVRSSKFNQKIAVTVHVGTDQNIEIEIFAEYKYNYALNELLVTKIVFQYV